MFNFDFPVVEACNKEGGEEVDLGFVLIEFLEEGILRGAFMDKRRPASGIGGLGSSVSARLRRRF